MADAPDRLKEALADRYTVEHELGEGGMATVYLADDLKHKRKVALKVLKPELAAVVGAERFLAEIETTANLQHPHILPLFDSGEADGFLFYVMPFVDGETLRDQIDAQKQLPVDDAVRIATDMAEALDYAHRAGVVHRDIKPANVLMHEGRPMIADFGIALAVGAAGGARLTETGLSVGTPYYMSPEQATGDQAVGAASDTYALGCVLYEMLVGEPPYLGNTAQAVLGKIIAGKPVDPTEQRKSIPANVDAAVRRALEKLPADRFTTAKELADALANPAFRHGVAEAAGVRAGPGPWKGVAMALAGTTALALVGLGWSITRPAAPQPVLRYSLAMPPEEAVQLGGMPQVELAPDGSRFVYRGPGSSGAGAQLWVRSRDQLHATPLPGTEGAFDPFFSPDGSRVGFYVFDGALAIKAVSLNGGPPVTVADSGFGGGGASWGPDGYIYADGTSGVVAVEGLVRIPETGGAPELITFPDTSSSEMAHKWTDALPNGRGLLFTVIRAGGSPEDRDIAVLDLATGEYRVLARGIFAKYSASGHLLYVTPDGTLMGAPFDQDALALTGEPVALIEGLRVNGNGSSDVQLSHSGTLYYTTGLAASSEDTHFVWLNRQGQATPVDPDWLFDPGDVNVGWALSPDDTRLAFRAQTDAGTDIWIKELPDGPLSRLTFWDGWDWKPRWTPDGRSVTFLSDREGNLALWTKRADGIGEAELLFDYGSNVAAGFWAPDGERLVLRVAATIAGQAGGRDIITIRPGIDSVAVPLMAEDYDESAPALSPDGRWIAYQSNETGSEEIFVRPFPDVDAGRWQVSTGGGTSPLWAHNGRELFYLSGNREMMVAEVATDAGFRIGERQVLFPIGPEYLMGNAAIAGTYDITLDDQTFLTARFGDSSEVPNELIVVENFFEVLRERVGN